MTEYEERICEAVGRWAAWILLYLVLPLVILRGDRILAWAIS